MDKIEKIAGIADDVLHEFMEEMKKDFLDQVIRIQQDPNRPIFHFTPIMGWMNDPIPFYHKGEYHIFFQYYPGAACWGRMHWGHVVSKDLLNWSHLPTALFPTTSSPDQDGCWTGCVIQNGKKFAAFYTGVFPQQQCLAFSDDLIKWEKFPNNPIIESSQKPKGFGETFRDPCVWQEKGEWYMIVGGLQEGIGGSPFLFVSSDLIHWKYLYPLYVGPAAYDECPDFFSLGDAHVLLSSRNLTRWAVGEYRDTKFVPERTGIVDFGAFYAGKTLLDSKGRRILFGWIREKRPSKEQILSGWSGALSLPRVITLLPNGFLKVEPAKELELLREEHEELQNKGLVGYSLSPGEIELGTPSANHLEILLEISDINAQRTGVVLPGGENIILDLEGEKLAESPFKLTEKNFKLRIFVDGSIVEIFANDTFSKSERWYFPKKNTKTVKVFCEEGSIFIKKLSIWKMRSLSTTNIYH
ncbi:MAG: GH32 C-terminal domain-containing protein [Candidatus Atribacteria bacterium]|nr:GH32 C-terminal domain-containing protein [Candidatus Atribacteria bacterium]MCD6350134.1 GH32 C-terminal domain-containing protein [Candidatus Atribacteria bacterium]